MRYQPEFRHIPSENDMKNSAEFTSLGFDPNGPIDFDVLKEDIASYGPIRLDYPALKVLFVLNIEPCRCAFEDCKNDVISLSQISGFTTLATSIKKERLLECRSLGHFFIEFLHNPFKFYSSSGEHQHLEGQIEQHLGIVPMDVYRDEISLEELTEKMDLSAKIKEDFWQAHNLRTIFNLFIIRRKIEFDFRTIELSDQVGEWFESTDSFKQFLDHFYDLGFLSGRLVSEYFIRAEIEPIAEKGEKAAEEAAKKGKMSRSDARKRERLVSFMEKIEGVKVKNPDMTEAMVFEVAFKQAIPKGTQGSGQFENYCTEIRSEEPYKTRYQNLFHQTT